MIRIIQIAIEKTYRIIYLGMFDRTHGNNTTADTIRAWLPRPVIPESVACGVRCGLHPGMGSMYGVPTEELVRHIETCGSHDGLTVARSGQGVARVRYWGGGFVLGENVE